MPQILFLDHALALVPLHPVQCRNPLALLSTGAVFYSYETFDSCDGDGGVVVMVVVGPG